jgi:hypothetical protein
MEVASWLAIATFFYAGTLLFQQMGASYCTRRSCFHDATARCVGNRIISKDIGHHGLLILTPSDYYPWGAMKGAVYKYNPYAILELKEAIANFIRNIPPIELSRIFALRVYMHVGASSTICCYLRNMINACELMYRNFLNILIVYVRCAGTFGLPCSVGA